MVHCFFEQSGTFKNEFIKLGYEAEDYDIQNNFGETDNVIDLFSEIDDAYDHKRETIFDTKIKEDDLIVAFYPCIFFCATSQMGFSMGYTNYKKLDDKQKIEAILKRSDNRKEFYDRLIRFVGVCLERNLRMVFENPWSMQTYLKANFLKAPDVVDMDRTKLGDDMKKSTAYWFWNIKPKNSFVIQEKPITKTVSGLKGGHHAGLCSEERSMINPDYARNWIKKYIIGEDDYSHMPLFETF